MSQKVTVYSRDGCHLCEVALGQLRALQGEYGFELIEIDIEGDAAIHAAYLERIPVIALDGQELYDFEIDQADLKSRLLRASAR